MTTIYNSVKTLLFNGGIDLDTDNLRILLLSDSQAYTPNIDSEAFVDDVVGVSATELNATNYTRKSLSVTVTQDNVDNEAVADATDLTWTALGGTTDDTIGGAIVYREVGADDSTPADDDLIAHLTSADFPMPTNGGDVSLNFHTEGLLNLG